MCNNMKLIIAGGRDFNNYQVLDTIVSVYSDVISEVVCGDARGADLLGADWAYHHNIPVKHFPAEWEKYGKAAGNIRNADMGDYGDALIAFWDGQSRGTMNMIKTMKLHRKLYWVYNYQGKLIDHGW